jgi:hypothetical protein
LPLETWNLQLPAFTVARIEITETIQCPYCGQAFELTVDTSTPSQRFTTDCEICCRPLQVTVECEPGEILSLDVQGA